MLWIAREELPQNQDTRNALSKAREDVLRILKRKGAAVLEVPPFSGDRYHAGKLRKLYFHYAVYRSWRNVARSIAPGDVLVLQYPVFNHSLLFDRVIRAMQKRRIRVIGIVHDLDAVRKGADTAVSAAQRKRHALEELRALRQMDAIIVHNERMRQFLHDTFGIPRGQMTSLEIFDYLEKEGRGRKEEQGDEREDRGGSFPVQGNGDPRCVIAGNLDPQKAGYVYHLPASPRFELYGIHYRDMKQSNVRFHGAFETDEILSSIEGEYGLVWDGDSPDTCSGSYGQYLKYNNPHKTSLYLAAGLPVIVWDQAAIAEFVLENQCGFCVSSLSQLQEKTRMISHEQYAEMKRNAIRIGQRLRDGYYTGRAVDRIGYAAARKQTAAP